MIHSIHEIPVTPTSKPFSTAVERCSMRDYGYVETEYFVSGTSNVYASTENGDMKVEYPDVPYTNRMVIRRPADASKCNGHVIVEILNASARYDIERMWIVSNRYFMNHGVIYVGLTSKPDVFTAMKKYDPERYSALSWPNPRPEELREDPVRRGSGRLTFMLKDQECGLFWDMLTEMAELLRTDGELNPIHDCPVRYVSLTGWSQSSGYLTRYVNSFAYRQERNQPIFDGYFAAGGVYSFSVPLQQNEYFSANPGCPFVRRIEQPYVMVQTESENGSLGAMDVPRQNSDEPTRLCRIYEIPGSTHDYRRAMNDFYAGEKQIDGVNYPSIYRGQEAVPNNYPCDYAMNAAYHHFFNWIESGAAPNPAPRFVRDHAGNNVTDALGNALGGMRTAFVDMPTRRYVPWTMWESNGQVSFNCMYGHEEVFSPAFLKELYGSLAEYEKRVRKVTAGHIALGFVLKEEAELLIQEAIALAAQAGLE